MKQIKKLMQRLGGLRTAGLAVMAAVGLADAPAWGGVAEPTTLPAIQGYSLTAVEGGTAYCVQVFTNTTATITWTVPANVNSIDYLVVGGGGGSGSSRGLGSGSGAGGGGAVLTGAQSVTAGSSISIKVGVGGTGAPDLTTDNGTNGGDSSLTYNSAQKIARGGGGGASYKTASTYGQGQNVIGASTVTTYGAGGGGGIRTSHSSGGAGENSHNGFGNSETYSGSGGGANGAATATAPGAGVWSSITGRRVEYGRGGQGGIQAGSNVRVYPTNGRNGTGCGASGVAGVNGESVGYQGARGGDGAVIIRYAIGNGSVIGQNRGYEYEYSKDGTSYHVCVYTNTSNSTTWTKPSGVTSLDYLVIGGGGGGGNSLGGGGGAGGFLEDKLTSVASSYAITVGKGGAGGITSHLKGYSGGPSSLGGSIQALGGGGGASYDGNAAADDGGSGGGGSTDRNNGQWWQQSNKAGSGTEGQGYAGGAGNVEVTSGGGGGAGGRGAAGTASANGAGGLGKQSGITGVDSWYAGGGGAGGNQVIVAPALGSSGGGDGGGVGGNATTPGSGGGGGCGTAGCGGDGVVILRYEVASAHTVTLSKSGTGVGDIYYRVGDSGSYTKYTGPFDANANATVSYYSADVTGYKQTNPSGSPASFTMGAANVTKNLTATANTYTVSFNANGGTGGQTATVQATYDAAMPTISTTAPTKPGYTFGGWYDAATGGTQYYTAAGASARNWDKAANTTLYAHWTANTYTVTLNKQSGTGGSGSVTATYGAAMPSATMPTREGYIFQGYYDTDATSGGTQYYTAAGASARNWDKAANTTLYARWMKNVDPGDMPKEWGYIRSYEKGGTNYVAYVYTNNSASMTFTVPAGVTSLDYLVVGGGGGGGGTFGGGGGAGGFVEGKVSSDLAPSYVITVGPGGAGVVDNGTVATVAGASSFGSIIAKGGGCGGNYYMNGVAGASGGGGGVKYTTAGTATQGYKGGTGYSKNSAGGGGGAGDVGGAGDSGQSGNGGPGKTSDITGVECQYAGGGGGCGDEPDGAVHGVGSFGGGDGGAGKDDSGCDATTPGSGGGGAGRIYPYGATGHGGRGADGIVVVRYEVACPLEECYAHFYERDYWYPNKVETGHKPTNVSVTNAAGQVLYKGPVADQFTCTIYTNATMAGVSFETVNVALQTYYVTLTAKEDGLFSGTTGTAAPWTLDRVKYEFTGSGEKTWRASTGFWTVPKPDNYITASGQSYPNSRRDLFGHWASLTSSGGPLTVALEGANCVDELYLNGDMTIVGDPNSTEDALEVRAWDFKGGATAENRNTYVLRDVEFIGSNGDRFNIHQRYTTVIVEGTNIAHLGCAWRFIAEKTDPKRAELVFRNGTTTLESYFTNDGAAGVTNAISFTNATLYAGFTDNAKSPCDVAFKLGELNKSQSEDANAAVWSGPSIYLASGSSLTIDATEKGVGTYRLVKTIYDPLKNGGRGLGWPDAIANATIAVAPGLKGKLVLSSDGRALDLVIFHKGLILSFGPAN